MKAIQTRYLGPTDYRGSRIKAWAEGVGSVTVPYDHAAKDPHVKAVDALLEKTGWYGELVGGGLPNGDYCWVFIGSPEKLIVKLDPKRYLKTA